VVSRTLSALRLHRPHCRCVRSARTRLGAALYEDLFDEACRAGHQSDAFHAALGFAEVGSARIHGGAKTARYLAREFAP
jgi:predicted GNAT superfamily acetyltransferase